MNYPGLDAELTADPLGRVYSGMTSAEAAADLNTAYRSRNKTLMSASEVLQAVNIAEWNALTDAEQRRIWDVLHIGDVNPFGIEAVIFQSVFGASVTITALQAARVEDITRATELGLGVVKVGHVTEVRKE